MSEGGGVMGCENEVWKERNVGRRGREGGENKVRIESNVRGRRGREEGEKKVRIESNVGRGEREGRIK